MAKVSVVGAGAWGTAIAKVLAENGHDTRVWCLESELKASINERHLNELFLPGVELPASLAATNDLLEAVEGMDLVVLAVPSLFLLSVARKMLGARSIMEGRTLIAVVTKGFIETDRGPRLIVETLEDYLPGFYRGNLVYVSGPSHAEEVARGRITGLAAASQNGRNAIRVRELMQNRYLLVFPSLDVTGVQVAGAVKNVIAIAFGMLDALKADSPDFGDNTESMLLAAGLNEIMALGRALGATHPETFTSIAGVGDLDVTCRSIHGRNRRFGREIIEKDLLAPFSGLDDLIARIKEIGYLPEGAVAVSHVMRLAEERKVPMPITAGVHRILDRKVAPTDFIKSFLQSMSGRQSGLED
ncbi:MAG: NAD(P)-dependent glycerol-3-phosphate dehydrogenase [Spirochaetales bacterium]|nr:NAD(P)-dependent glycerol-3-phosphate dehydrogenase [Spirochaetales bacterium]